MTSHEEKLRMAKLLLGERYLCHTTNHVKKAPHRTPENGKAVDVAKTFARVRKQGRDLA